MTTENNDDEDPYKNCCFYEKNVCGARKYGRVLYEGLENVVNLENNSVENYLKNNLHFKPTDQTLFSQWNERFLIENRVGHSLLPTDNICQYHRFKFGISYKPSKQCAHPLHKNPGTGRKAAPTSRLSLSTVMGTNEITPFSCVLGSQMCTDDRKKISGELLKKKETQQSMNESFIDESINHEEEEPYTPDVFILDELDDSNFNIAHDLSSTFCVSPVKFRITKPLEEVNDRNVRYIKRKRDEFLAAAGSLFDQAITPGQVIEAESSQFNQESTFSSEMHQLVESYDDSDSFGKLIILKLVDHDKYTKLELMNIFNCSKRKIDQARALKMEDKSVKTHTKIPFKRNRMNTKKSEHFLDWIISSGLLQDVAYGVKELKFESGESQSVPNTILQSKYSHTIQFYLDVCKEINYTPLSESSLWKLLKAIKPSQRKSLAGLDDITAEAMNGFQFLQNTIENLNCNKSLSHNLEKAKRYLKMNYQGHCNISSKIATHNTAYALSNPREEPCLGVSEEVCSECFNVFQVLSSMIKIASKTGNADLIYDVDLSVKSIIEYMKHQIRDEQQKQAKIYCSEQISDTTGFWLRDYSQKVLPRSYREGQKSYFGKKGMSMHIDIFYTKPQINLLKQVYYILIYRCDQSKLDTMNITDYVLSQFVQDFPRICNINGKSDNAGSYHGNQILENLFYLSKSKGLKLLRYDYNEPCRGKDQCDRESSGAKSLINSYVESGNDLLNTTDVFNALHYGKGVSNAKVGVIEIDSSQSTLEGQEIQGINSYHSAKFFEDHMKLYRYYGIGSGKVVLYNQAGFKPSYTIKTNFSNTSSHSKKIKKRNTKKMLLFCTNPSCASVFESVEELEQHTLNEKHISIKERSSMDNFKSSFAKKMKASLSSHLVISSTEVQISEKIKSTAVDEAPIFSEVLKQGWAIPKINTFRYSFAQKKFLYDLFMEGHKNGKKKSPEEVVTVLRNHFESTKDYVTTSQVRSLFSSFARKLNDGTLKAPTCPIGNKSRDTEEPVEHAQEPSTDDLNQDEVEDIIEEVIAKTATWEIGSWLVVRYKRKWLPGRIIPSEGTHHVEEGSFLVECMERRNSGVNRFRWPRSRDLIIVEAIDMLLEIDELLPVAETDQLSSGEVVWCELSKDDLIDANNALKKALREEQE